MAVEVVTPEEYVGDVIGDLNSRRGHDFQGQEIRGVLTTVRECPRYPSQTCLSYVDSSLRSMSSGPRPVQHDSLIIMQPGSGKRYHEEVIREKYAG